MEKESNSLVSVIIPAYNAEAFIAKTLESVITQTYRNLEILVIDDGSQDRTARIVEEYIEKDSRIQLFSQANAGVAAARNLGITKSKGEFIAPIDADDIWYPQNLDKQVECFVNNSPEIGLVYSWSVDIDEEDKPTGKFKAARIAGDVYTTLIAHNFIGNASATMMRRSCLDRVSKYDSHLRDQNAQGCEDWDLYLRIAESYEFRVVPEFLIGYRKVRNSMSRDYRTMAKSHALVIASVQRQYSYLPQYLFNFSASNLYIYFAHQSNANRNHDITRFWLKKAFVADRLTFWIKPGLYQLFLSSTWGSLTKILPIPSSSTAYNSNNSSNPNIRSGQVQGQLLPFEASRLKLSLMIAANNAFHWFIKTLVKNWGSQKDNFPKSFLMEEKQ